MPAGSSPAANYPLPNQVPPNSPPGTTAPSPYSEAPYYGQSVQIVGGFAASPILPGATTGPEANGVTLPTYFTDTADTPTSDQLATDLESHGEGAYLLYVNGVEKLAYDLNWYDAVTDTLYFRSNEMQPITTPATQCAVEADDAQLSFSGDWITVNGLQIKDGDNGIHINGNDDVVENCRVTNCSIQGILASGNNTRFTGNYVDAIGGEVVDKQDGRGASRDNLEHDLYISGSGMLIEGNFFGRALSGSCAGDLLRHGGHHRVQR